MVQAGMYQERETCDEMMMMMNHQKHVQDTQGSEILVTKPILFLKFNALSKWLAVVKEIQGKIFLNAVTLGQVHLISIFRPMA
jgi:hypothetical protein